jgi:hypothetical protein
MCAACKVDFREGAGRAREEVWGLLPGWFGLEGEGQGRATQQRAEQRAQSARRSSTWSINLSVSGVVDALAVR